jgi:hypothetical protein
VYVSGSGVVAVRLVGAAGTAPETAADGFAITFGSSAAAVDAPTVKLVKGRASTFFTAGAAAGSAVTTATLDSETVSATTRIIAAGGGAIDDGAAAPSVADARPRPVSRYVARSAFLKRTLRFSLSKGFRQAVATNRHASVRTTYMISHYDARAMRLRPVTNYTHRPFVIARVRTRAIRGSRIVTAPVNARPAFAIKRANRRVAVHVLSVIRTADGKVRRGSSRLVLPADAL